MFVNTSSAESQILVFSQEELDKPGQELDAKLHRAMRSGIFYVEMSAGVRELEQETLLFANSWHKDDEIKARKPDGLNGYHGRSNLQIESLYFDRAHREELLPPAVQKTATAMGDLAVRVLKLVLKAAQIPESCWAKATGQLSDGGGTQHFALNHYRASDTEEEGLRAHLDFGMITVLGLNQEGLEARIDGVWKAVQPLDGHFVINIGRALQTLVDDSSVLQGVVHRVPHVSRDRVSFNVALDNDPKSSLYRWNGETLEVMTQVYRDYLNASFEESYQESN